MVRQTKLQCSFLWAGRDSKVHAESVNRSITYFMLLENLGPMPTFHCIQRNKFQSNAKIIYSISAGPMLHSCLLCNVHAKCAKHIKIDKSSTLTHQWCGVLRRWKQTTFLRRYGFQFKFDSSDWSAISAPDDVAADYSCFAWLCLPLENLTF